MHEATYAEITRHLRNCLQWFIWVDPVMIPESRVLAAFQGIPNSVGCVATSSIKQHRAFIDSTDNVIPNVTHGDN
jgi:hypothetical protein